MLGNNVYEYSKLNYLINLLVYNFKLLEYRLVFINIIFLAI